MPPVIEMEATGEQLSRELPERLADFKEQKFHIIVTPVETPATETPRKKTITEILIEMAKDVPAEERAKVPTDLGENLDHYIYGRPKK